MSLQERIYSVLVVSATDKLNMALPSLLPESHFRPVFYAANISAAKRAWGERIFDYVIINSPLPDDTGIRFAIDISNASGAVVLMLVNAGLRNEVQEKVAEYGVFTLPKPLSRPVFALSLDWLSSARERLRRQERKTLSIEEKMSEIRIVNQAKWLLIAERKMDEPQAHRYLERQAMDRCITRRKVAEEVISFYSAQ